MPAVVLHCPLCTGAIQIDSSFGGQQVACPLCQGLLEIPPESVLLGAAGGEQFPHEPSFQPSLEMPSGFPGTAAPPLMQLACPTCQGLFQVPPEMAGQQVGCPHCNQLVALPPLEPEYAQPQFELPNLASPNPEVLFTPGAWEPQPSAPEPESPPPERLRAERPAVQPSPSRLPPQTAKTERKAASQAASDILPPRKKPVERQAASADLLPPNREPRSDARTPASHQSPAPQQPATSTAEKQSAAEAKRERRERRHKRTPVDELLPPGAADVAALLPPGAAEANPVEALLPPGAAADVTPNAAATSQRQTAVIDTLLPPGAQETPGAAGQQVAIPKAPVRPQKPPENAPPGSIVMPTPDGGYVTVKEPTAKTIVAGNQVIELRKLTPEEKAKRRMWKNLIFGAFCLLIMFIVLAVLMNK